MLLNHKYVITQHSSEATEKHPLIDFNGSLLISASWEIRSQAILDRIDFTKVRRVILIRYENRGKTQVSGNIRNRVKDLCKKHRIRFTEVEFGSIGETFSHYYNTAYSLASAISSSKEPWIIDISSMPRRLWCSLLFLFDRIDSIRTLHFYYSHPKYIFSEDEYRNTYYEHTLGEWSLSDVPFAPLAFGNGLYKTNIISTGFEYDQLKAIIYRHDPDHNSIISASPGFTDSYTRFADRTTERIKAVFEIPDSDIHRAPVRDVEMVITIAREIVEANNEHDISLICAGNKLHSLALCLTAITYKNANFYVRIPAAYKESPTPPSGQFDVVTIENLLVTL
ncbi:hypothetical protein DNX69_07695 [Rhodopseudomonas palustris]|uniref:Uncharacterized protein n=1 Tax=Rhodopseudomonas palustris TaxID=1076 RepID=A0A323UJU9_RHOPL|nr:hypothetical protein [Rhodopseudomonas palustris]PZA12764.1 hypothetical protein DNX69_07695 [Rhodopseudomonas palustris]